MLSAILTEASNPTVVSKTDTGTQIVESIQSASIRVPALATIPGERVPAQAATVLAVTVGARAVEMIDGRGLTEGVIAGVGTGRNMGEEEEEGGQIREIGEIAGGVRGWDSFRVLKKRKGL